VAVGVGLQRSAAAAAQVDGRLTHLRVEIEATQQFRSIDPDSRMPSRQADRQRSGTQQLRQPADVVSRLP